MDLMASVNNNIVSLSWNSVDVDDFNYYSIHRAPDSLFQSDINNFVGYSLQQTIIQMKMLHLMFRFITKLVLLTWEVI